MFHDFIFDNFSLLEIPRFEEVFLPCTHKLSTATWFAQLRTSSILTQLNRDAFKLKFVTFLKLILLYLRNLNFFISKFVQSKTSCKKHRVRSLAVMGNALRRIKITVPTKYPRIFMTRGDVDKKFSRNLFENILRNLLLTWQEFNKKWPYHTPSRIILGSWTHHLANFCLTWSFNSVNFILSKLMTECQLKFSSSNF